MELPQYGSLVDEKALLTIEEEEEEIKNIFLDIAKDAAAVICCRVSPLQKSQVVKMMKKYNPDSKTLAIGDGGNDVSMIMEAHIGVGIYGEEGLRAVQNSDYAIGEFRFLHELLFFHGRTNYMRNSQCILYFFYKNFVFTFLQFVYGFYCNFTGQTIIDDWYITLFNLLFTSLPLGARALLDHDVKREDGDIIYLMLPFLYLENRDNPFFTMRKFFLTLLKGTIHSVINFFGVIYMLDESIDEDGHMGGLWFCSVNLFTNILIIVSIELVILTKYHTWINFVILIVITFVAYVIFIIVVHHMSMFNSVGTMYVAFSSGKIWLNMLLVGGTCCIIDLFLLGLHFIFFPSLATKLEILVNKKIDMSLKNFNNMPKSIKEILSIYEGYIEFDGNFEYKNVDTKKSGDNIDNYKTKEIDNEAEIIKMKDNKTKEEKNLVINEGSSNTNENEKNAYIENKTKNVNTKSDVIIIKGKNDLIMDEENNSKEVFIKNKK
jgi:phospholipid-transporting ATPase